MVLSCSFATKASAWRLRPNEENAEVASRRNELIAESIGKITDRYQKALQDGIIINPETIFNRRQPFPDSSVAVSEWMIQLRREVKPYAPAVSEPADGQLAGGRLKRRRLHSKQPQCNLWVGLIETNPCPSDLAMAHEVDPIPRGSPAHIRQRAQQAHERLLQQPGSFHECPDCGAPKYVPHEAPAWNRLKCAFDRRDAGGFIISCAHADYACHWRQLPRITSRAAPARQAVVEELLREKAAQAKARESFGLDVWAAYVKSAVRAVRDEACRRTPPDLGEFDLLEDAAGEDDDADEFQDAM